MSLAKKIVVITGAGSGIGRETAVLFAKEGARVIVADINEEAGRQTLKLIQDATKTSSSAAFVKCNVTNRQDIENAIHQAKVTWGKDGIDMMINNAGIGLNEDCIETGNDDTTWKKTVDINLTGVIEGTQLAIKNMKKYNKGGVIINTASTAGITPVAGIPVYAATKAGVVNFTKSLAGLEHSANIRVVALCPTFTTTPLTLALPEREYKAIEQAYGLLHVREVAAAMLELAVNSKPGGGAVLVVTKDGLKYWRSTQKVGLGPSKL